MGRRRNMSIAANPILIGGVTVLMAIVAVFLSYNANHGLPFVPTYKVNVVVPNADGLIAGNEVRIGGERAGVVKQDRRARQQRRLDRRRARAGARRQHASTCRSTRS